MSLVGFVVRTRVLFLLCIFSGVIYGEGASPVLSVESRNPLKLSVFDGGKMYSLPVPTDFMGEVEGVYDEVRIQDLTGDGVGEVLFDLAGDGVNSCSRVLHYERDDRLLKELLFDGGGLCNFAVRDGYIISSYKDGAAWAEDIYVAAGGKVDIKISDRCIGCGEVVRIVYGSDGSPVKSLVSDDMKFETRTELVSTVVSLQAKVFSSPVTAQSTQKYLMRGDIITLLGFDSSSGEDWVEFRFSGKTTIEGWLKCSELASCSKL
ncbi:hypothetical protein HBO12_02415 [Pseudomonas sp. WS 5059]|uniref:hypothetical protein n=1 Tax=Pseudomonas sp. WS 5059 TaxID=2717491 RepID=UPI0014726FD8|nr:hypothetical protein [Pseudomonas sp. WS 5059]NMY01790.1 hypothetical protein [Pseudomonas sp. WS 5059]